MARKMTLEEYRGGKKKKPISKPPKGYKGGKGKVSSGFKSTSKISEVMEKYRQGQLHAGKTGSVVTSPKQAKAIALAEAQWQAHKDRAGGAKAAAAENNRKQKGGAIAISKSSRRQPGGSVKIKRG